jgi:nucleoside-diphosphate-sugar epimerase
MRTLVTGGAGFISRWVVKKLIEDGHQVWVLDNLSNGNSENLSEFSENTDFMEMCVGDIKESQALENIFTNNLDICYHLAACINVQDSIDYPQTTFDNDVVGTFNVLEECRQHNTKLVFVSTCMVYDRASSTEPITENHPTKPASPYAGAKLAGENLALSYYHAYDLPVVIVRPFNTYGPFQKGSSEGGVVSIFITRKLTGQTLNVYGDGTQTRDFLYVEDCANFIARAGYSDAVNGEIINAGSGVDVTISDLALMVVGNPARIAYVPHIHPQSEIPKLVCDYNKAKRLLGWTPKVPLVEGLKLTEEWIKAVSGLG